MKFFAFICIALCAGVVFATREEDLESKSQCLKSNQIPSIEDLSKVVQTYYDSENPFNFYQNVWGGESIHVGLYDELDTKTITDTFEQVKEASRLTTQRLFKASGQTLTKESRICDFGSAYGGTARYAAKTFGSHVLCVDLSSKENKLNREKTEAENLSRLITVQDGSFFEVDDACGASFDTVVSQDSLLHAGPQRHRAIQEAARLLKEGGYMVFTDIMQAEDAKPEQLQAVYDRINLDNMGTPETYKRIALKNGMEFVRFQDRTSNLAEHYGRIQKILQTNRAKYIQDQTLSAEFIDNMLSGLQAWLDAAKQKTLLWGFIVLRKTEQSSEMKSLESKVAAVEKIEKTVKTYYDSKDSFNFYKKVWGGESIHVGLYDKIDKKTITNPFEQVKAASRKTVEYLFRASGQTLNDSTPICDFGSAYGGTARYAAKTFGSPVLCVDLSSKENKVNREKTEAENLSRLVTVQDGSFFNVDAPDASFHLVISQDALDHTGPERHRAFKEAARLLKKGGFMVFTDLMQSKDAKPEEMKEVYARIQLDEMASPETYMKIANDYGLKLIQYDEQTENLAAHYKLIHDILQERREKFIQDGTLSEAFITDMLSGLQAWIKAAAKGNLRWGFIILQKE